MSVPVKCKICGKTEVMGIELAIHHDFCADCEEKFDKYVKSRYGKTLSDIKIEAIEALRKNRGGK